MAKGLKNGLGADVDSILEYDGTYVNIYHAGTLIARFNSAGSLSINGGLTDNAGI